MTGWVLAPDWPEVSYAAARSLKGRSVDVLLGANEDGTPHHVTGKLVTISPTGDFVLDTSDGRRRYWPWLSIREAS